MIKLSEAELRDRIRGAFWGAAIDDALGMPTEFLSRNEVYGRFGYVTGFESYTGKIIQRPWDVGEWTDDFSQALRVAFVLVEHKGLDERALAPELAEWAKEDGLGCGALTAELLRHEKFLAEPSEVADEIWQRTEEGRNAPNGALMRTFPTALWDFRDAEACCRGSLRSPSSGISWERLSEGFYCSSYAIGRSVPGELPLGLPLKWHRRLYVTAIGSEAASRPGVKR